MMGISISILDKLKHLRSKDGNSVPAQSRGHTPNNPEAKLSTAHSNTHFQFKRKRIFGIHLVFWGLYILLGIWINVAVHHDLKVTTALYEKDLSDVFTWVGYGRTILTCYISLWVFTYLFERKQYLMGVLAVLGLIFCDVGLRYVVEQLFIGPVFGLWQYPKTITVKEYLIDNVFYSALGIFACFFLKIINDYFIKEKIKQERLTMELQFLKSQVNPHFLFNSFNNLYGLSLSDPGKTPDAILKLAELTRYMIYESSADRVLLSKEVKYIENIIELQKLRYEKMVYLELHIQYEDKGEEVAPLLLISFIENAFKHGELHDKEHPVEILLMVRGATLSFNVYNKISQKGNKDIYGGIGLKNVRRRLELLYPNMHVLNVVNDGQYYNVGLELKLN